MEKRIVKAVRAFDDSLRALSGIHVPELLRCVNELVVENNRLRIERDQWRARVEDWCDDEGCAIPCTPNCTRSEAERA